MGREKFEAVLVVLVPQILNLITESCQLDEVSAHKAFYGSKVYTLLEQEETKLWHFSALTLFHMFEEERQTGTFTFPEED